ncbi:MAG: NAD(P)-dependent oxidoreductase [Caldimonas sp.]
MSRVLVTGGSGFIGANLVEALLAAGREVLDLDLVAPETPAARPHWQRVDIVDRSALLAAFDAFGPELAFHLAARTDLNGGSIADYAANTSGVANVIEAASRSDALRRIVFASSRLVCRIGYQPLSPHDYQPTTPYGESKVAGEKLVYAAQGLRVAWALVRPTSIWGPGFKVPYRNFFDAVRQGRYLHPRGVRVRKSFGYVGNTTAQLQRLGEAPADAIHGRMFYLADYEPIEVFEWGSAIAREFAAPAVREVPLGLLQALALAGDGLLALGWKNAPLTRFRLANLVTSMVHELGPLRQVCGPLPVDAQQGVAATVAWMRGSRKAPGE